MLEWPCYGIIQNGNQFQFEDFWKYVESEMPDYLKALKAHLKKLETNDKRKVVLITDRDLSKRLREFAEAYKKNNIKQ